jgi:hypothetical protein
VDDQQYLKILLQRCADEGKLIEAGWFSFRAMAIAPDASSIQLRTMRMAFMTGALHLFTSIITSLNPESEPTQSDLRRMELIDKEFSNFDDELKLLFSEPEGTA